MADNSWAHEVQNAEFGLYIFDKFFMKICGPQHPQHQWQPDLLPLMQLDHNFGMAVVDIFEIFFFQRGLSSIGHEEPRYVPDHPTRTLHGYL